ncbi:MAG: hypothetical protein JSW58_04345 [Candidatus Latescibacterota bacterium]|nr:MAG: hypothetical protein JSW58_04345 [Candidatus Latescibacterota bacterium]
MTGLLKQFFSTQISKEQAKDTGMAMVLIALLVGFFSHNDLFFRLAIPLLVLDMVVPKIYYPVAIVWLGLSRLLGTIVSRILLTVIFFVLVLPVGLLRRLIAKDALQLRKFRRGSQSVMKVRDHTYVPADIERPY